MSSHEQPSVAEIADEVRGWVDAGRETLAARARITEAGDAAIDALRGATVSVRRNGQVLWQVLPLRPANLEHVRDVARQALLPEATADVHRELERLATTIGSATDSVRAVTGFQRFFAFGGRRANGENAAKELTEYRAWYRRRKMDAAFARLEPDDSAATGVLLADALDTKIGLASRLDMAAATTTLEPARTFALLPNAMKLIQRAAHEEAAQRAAALEAGNEVRRAETARLLAEMPVDRLKEATRDRIRVGALLDNGIATVLEVIKRGNELEFLPGIGEMSATYIRGAARTIMQSTFEEMPMRIDIRNRSAEHTALLRCLRGWDATRKARAAPDDLRRVRELADLAAALEKDVVCVVVSCPSTAGSDELKESIQTVVRCARQIADARDAAQSEDPWNDFLARPADYFALLAELGFILEDEEKTHGDLSEEIIEAVRAFELKIDYLNVSLRGYQSFGARFALVQRKVIIGDEMGLGKTVEALAVLAHLRATGSQHTLVICPAAVVTNWMREVQSKSKLTAHRLHGPDRTWAGADWVRRGGVAVTTFETLKWLTTHVGPLPDIGCVVVDEAHYIKNPSALRTQRAARIIEACSRAVLLTGTPLENRLDEFRNLVGYLRPDLVVDATEFAPTKFRRQVAPAYLRRNQEDVLTELPELVEVDEWLEMSQEDFGAYRTAVAEGNFMAMRRAAMMHGAKSVKLQRLCEIVEEAEDNGRRVVVFSYFLDVLQQVAAALPGRVFGPLTGAVPAVKRQKMIDDFSDAQHGAVLVAQISAGGVGLNIQAASVVIICEPQLKPTTEWQAIARAHRMGQVQSVQVHRLLSEEGVDERLCRMLERKSELFEDFARRGDIAESAPEAYDISENELARQVIAAERERLFGRGAPVTPPTGPKTDNRENLPVPQRPDSGAVQESSPAPQTNGFKPTPNASPLAAADIITAKLERVAEPKTDEVEQVRAADRVSSPRHPELLPYPVFSEVLPPVSEIPTNQVAGIVARIVLAEGPITGWRIHEVYKNCSTGRESRDEFSRLLNSAISAAERRKLIVAENPYNQTGNKPRTFRLSTQSSEIARELGPRTISVVPPTELAQYCRVVSASRPLSDGELLRRIAQLLGITLLTAEARNAILAAKRLAVRAEPSISRVLATDGGSAADASAALRNAVNKGSNKAQRTGNARKELDSRPRSPFYDTDFVNGERRGHSRGRDQR
ncbi:DEAD/DEAH box helicase [Mycobacterium sp. pW045]|uniref:DEAD/DEAH box helicase n=1 Tax=Mycobacterium sp. pW045 TaxID=3238984 RepID=UPI00351ADB64